MNAWIDWGFVAAFAAAWPAWETWYRLPRVRAAIEAGVPGRRVREYRSTMLQQWALTAVALVLVARGVHTLPAIGLTLPQGSGLAWTVGFVVLVLVFLRTQHRAATGTDAGRAAVRRQLVPLRWLLPATGTELAHFRALSVTAGICEEILFRGYLMAFLMPLGGNALLRSLVTVKGDD